MTSTMPKEYYGADGRFAAGHAARDTATPYWFKRAPFNPKGNYSSKPQWHAFKQRLQPVGDEDTAYFTYVAACGYSYRNHEVFNEPPTLRDTPVKTNTLRCAKCTAIIEKRKK